jgi:ribosome-associated translation inhibitor RaiA
MLAEGREAKYGQEFNAAIDRALDAIQRKLRNVAARARRANGNGTSSLGEFA